MTFSESLTSEILNYVITLSVSLHARDDDLVSFSNTTAPLLQELLGNGEELKYVVNSWLEKHALWEKRYSSINVTQG